ncbi:MAG: hypothetical protein ACREA0_14050 [bacterium]
MADFRQAGVALARRALWGTLRSKPLIQSVHHGPALAELVRRLTEIRAFDIIQVEFSWFAPYIRARHRR